MQDQKKTRCAIIKLHNIWKSSNINKNTKRRLYDSSVISVLLYGAECWRMKEKDVNKLSSILNGWPRKILKIYWRRKITNEELHKQSQPKNIRTILPKTRWRWLGHVFRKPSNDMTRQDAQRQPGGERQNQESQILVQAGENQKKKNCTRQRKVETTSPCPMCPRTKKGLGRWFFIHLCKPLSCIPGLVEIGPEPSEETHVLAIY